MKFYLVFLIGFFSFSCKKKEIEFIPSKVIDNVYFVENLPANDSVLKEKIKEVFIFIDTLRIQGIF